MKPSAIVAAVAWLSVLAGLWGVFLGHALDWRAGILLAGCVLIGTVAGTLSVRYQERGSKQP